MFSKSKPNTLYYGTSRKLAIIHAQFRLRCSNLKADLSSLHVIDDPFCICSNQIEDCEHFFFHCNLYRVQRVTFLQKLNRICTGVTITTDLLLYGNDMLAKDINSQIFALVETYILESERFL